MIEEPAEPARGRREDAGQAVTVVLVVVALGLLVIAIRVVLPLGRATDLSGRARSAADAAALAGAKAVKDQFIDLALSDLPDEAALTRWLACGAGSDDAANFAARNDAQVVRYCYAVSRDVVEVEVEGRTALNGALPRSRAEAAVGIRWSACRWRPDTSVPAPSPTPSPVPTPTPTGPVGPSRLIFDCGTLEVPFDVDPVTGHLVADISPDLLDSRIEPRLVG